jgi:hypothetical protein
MALTIADFEPVSSNLPPDSDVPGAHHLDTLVLRQLLAYRGFGKKGLTAHMAGIANSSGISTTCTALSRLHARRSGVTASEQTRMRAVSIFYSYGQL